MRRLVVIPALVFLLAGCPQTLLVADGGTDVEPYDGGGGTGGGGGGSGDPRDAGADAGDGGSSPDGGVDAGTRIGPFVWFNLTPSMPRPGATAVDGKGKNHVYVAYQNALIDRWDGRGWTVLNAQVGPILESLVAVADGGVFAGGAQRIAQCLDDGTCASIAPGGMVRRLCRGPNGIYLATTEGNNESSLWRFTGSGWFRLGSTQGSAGFRGCAVTPDGTAAYVAGNPFVYGVVLAAGTPIAEPSSNINRTWHAVWVTGTTVYAVADGKHVGTRPLAGNPNDWRDVFDGSGGGPLVASRPHRRACRSSPAAISATRPGRSPSTTEGAGRCTRSPSRSTSTTCTSSAKRSCTSWAAGTARVYFGVFAP